MSGRLRCEEGLAPVRIATPDGGEEAPCVFRRAGLAVARFEEAGRRTGYSITHEATGTRIGKVHGDQMQALATVAALLATSVDWTKGGDSMKEQYKACGERDKSLLGAILSGNIQYVKMEQA